MSKDKLNMELGGIVFELGKTLARADEIRLALTSLGVENLQAKGYLDLFASASPRFKLLRQAEQARFEEDGIFFNTFALSREENIAAALKHFGVSDASEIPEEKREEATDYVSDLENESADRLLKERGLR